MVKIHCHICGTYCAKKPAEIPFMIAPGADVEIVATCADCNRSGDNTTRSGADTGLDELKKIFGMFK